MKIILAVFIIAINIIIQPKILAGELSAKAIQEDIKVLGPKKVCILLYNDEKKWYVLLRNIALGNEEWLKTAVNLKEGSAAGASEMLSLAVGEALQHNPENVFKFTLGNFKIYEICGGPDVDDIRYDSYELSIKAINKRIQKVSLVKNNNLRDKCNECLQYLLKAKNGVAKFYKVDEQSP